MNSLILGIDEAGRGPAIGSMFIAGIMMNEPDLVKLKDLGIRDSKRLSANRREELYSALKELNTKIFVRELTAMKIDLVLKDSKDNLNLLEIRTMADIINEAKPSVAYVDAVSTPTYFSRNLDPHVQPSKPRLVVENRADDKYEIVGAASIVAKVLRDRSVAELREKHQNLGDLGSGYPSDPKTKRFVEQNVEAIRKYKLPFVRMEWESTKKILRRRRQTQL